jgi:hypothetical protein
MVRSTKTAETASDVPLGVDGCGYNYSNQLLEREAQAERDYRLLRMPM